MHSELSTERNKNYNLSIENQNLKQQIAQLNSQLANNFQNKNNIQNNSSDKLINLLSKKEEKINELKAKINELKEKIKRYPFILEKNERLMAIIFNSVDQKVNYPMICKNTDTINKLEAKLYEEYPNLSERENYFLCKGGVINKFQSFEKNKIKNGDIIILNQNDFS